MNELRRRRPRTVATAVVAAALATVTLAGCSFGSARRSTPAGPAAPATAAPSTTGAAGAAPVVPLRAAPRDTAAARGTAAPLRVDHCARNTDPQRVLVSIRAQHMWLCAGHRTVNDNPITSGVVGEWTSTPTGNYVIQGRTRNTVLTLNTGATYDVKYWIPFDGPLFGFHDSSWQNFPYGSRKYRTQGSHGCIHMPLGAIAFLYRWADRPTSVHIA